jgi:protein ImuA
MPLNTSVFPRLDRDRNHAETIDELRRLLPKLEGITVRTPVLPFGLPALDAHLPRGGLVYGALHEVAPETDKDMAAAFGFAAAILGRMPPGPILLVLSSRKFARCGQPYGHGLDGLGLDPAHLILVEARDEKQALWAMEEALRSAAPAAVAGTITTLDLRTSQRLHLAARDSRRPLLLLRPAGALGSSVAATRWHIGAAKAARDRFGLISRWRWRVNLERCRNGLPGQWLVEFDHAYRFSLAAALADPALPRGTGTQFFLRAG